MYVSVLEAIFAHAKKNSSKICLVDDTREITYGEYIKQALILASRLKELGIKRDSKVLVEASQSIDFLSVQLALQILGAIFVPVVANCSAQKIVDFTNKVSATLLILNKLTDQRNSVINRRAIILKELIESSKMKEPVDDIVFPKADDISEILFTTGTTGDEKGIVISFDNNIAIAENVISGVQMQEDNVEFILSPFNHSHGLRRYYANMVKGASVVMQSSVVFVKNVIEKIDKYHVNSMDLVPSALTAFLKLTQGALGNYKDSMRYIQLGSAPVLESDKEKLRALLPNTKLYNMYGSTESGVSCIYEFSNNTKINCIGKPAVNSTITVVDEQHKLILSSSRKPGYLACKSRANMLTYYGEENCAISDVMHDGVVYSNDVVYFDVDGDLILLGRKGSIINIGGHKVSPLTIESIAITYEDIVDCACIPITNEELGQVPKLFVQLRDPALKDYFDKEKFRTFLSLHLEHFMLPRSIEFIDHIPRTYKGSLQRNLLK